MRIETKDLILKKAVQDDWKAGFKLRYFEKKIDSRNGRGFIMEYNEKTAP